MRATALAVAGIAVVALVVSLGGMHHTKAHGKGAADALSDSDEFEDATDDDAAFRRRQRAQRHREARRERRNP